MPSIKWSRASTRQQVPKLLHQNGETCVWDVKALGDTCKPDVFLLNCIELHLLVGNVEQNSQSSKCVLECLSTIDCCPDMAVNTLNEAGPCCCDHAVVWLIQ